MSSLANNYVYIPVAYG